MSSSQRAAVPLRRRPGRPSAADATADVRERLLEAATEFAIERGLDGASIREIADRAQVSSAMIAYYFGDRRGLHDAMFKRALGEVIAQFETALADPGEDTDLIDTLIRLHATAMSANPWLPRAITREILAREGDLRGRFRELIGDRPVRLLRDAIAREIEAGTLRADLDAEMGVVTLLSLTAFPYLAGPHLCEPLGLEIDGHFRDRLIAHNREVIARGLRAPASERHP